MKAMKHVVGALRLRRASAVALLAALAACLVPHTGRGPVFRLPTAAAAGAAPIKARQAMVASQNEIASRIGVDALRDGGTAIDAAVATAFALAVVHPVAGNIGGGGFLVYRPASGDPIAYDFRETAPAKSSPTMFLHNGTYDANLHHNSYLAVGVPGTVAGLHLAWKEQGKLPWARLVQPAIALARDGFPVSEALAESLRSVLRQMQPYPASVAQFSKHGVPYDAGNVLKQPDLARTLARIGADGPAGFYQGETALALEKEMLAHGGLIMREDLGRYKAVRRTPLTGSYRGYDLISMPPPSSGGVGLIEMLNVLEGYDLAKAGPGSAAAVHLMTESMKRAYADRARYLGDADFNPEMPLLKLISKAYATDLRKSIDPDHTEPSSSILSPAAISTPTTGAGGATPSDEATAAFSWPYESEETTHVSVVDAHRNAVAMTYTLEAGYGVKIVVPGAGFLLNNEMGDFNAGPGLTNTDGLIGTPPNLAEPGKRMLSSMTPTILSKDGRLFMVTGSPGGRTIINTVLETIVNVVDYGMNAQEAVDAGRFHHQWLPDRIQYEKYGLSPDSLALLERRGHTLQPVSSQGVAQVIVYRTKEDLLEGGSDRRAADGAAVGVNR